MIALLLLGCGGDLLHRNNPSETDTSDSPAELACPEDEALFQAHVWQPALGDQCVLCHVEGAVAGNTRMVLDPNDMLSSLRAAASVGEDLVLKPTGQHPDGHGGGDVISPDSAAAQALAFWVAWGQGTCEEPEDVSDVCDDLPGDRLLRRLTHAEYDRTVEDLLGVESGYGDGFASDEVVEGFRNDAAALTVSSLLADQYRLAAEALAWQVDLDPLVPCDPYAMGRANCAQVVIEDFGLRAFRRPLSQQDLDRYQALWTEVAREDGFDEGLRWVIAAMLQSPSFLYRSELGEKQADGTFALTDWELATALSYQFWGTTPDAELLALAEAGTLNTPEQLDEQAIRLASDDRALATAADLVDTWLQLDRLQTVSREGLSTSLRDAMATETRALVMDVAGDGGTLDDLMLARHTFLDAELAEHYGLTGEGEVELDGVRYGGLLTQGSVLTAHALPTGSSPVHRGVLVRERLLCEDLPAPPANLDTSPPEVNPDLSTRERYAQHTSDDQCASCHNRIDPLGFGFEAFDGLGRWRAEDAGAPVDATGELDGADFDGVFELSELLLDDPRFRSCYVRTWRRWATGTEACAEDPGSVGLMDPLLELVDRAHFTQRVGDSSELDTLAAGARPVLQELPEDEGGWGDIEFELNEVSRWNTGYCADAVVSNFGQEAVVWEVETTIEGTIVNIWNAQNFDNGDGTTRFIGVSYNATVDPGSYVTFGFCAAL
ncbi:MAG: DUF1588 domain-containing protein [Alphaproteobacteria bacterium]|nr:DUF1588 domain-containing protein [Alphaproteobacteria bacterium]